MSGYLSNGSCNQTSPVLVKKTETWRQYNLVVSHAVVKRYFDVRNQGNKYSLVPGTSASLLNENDLT